MHNWYENPVTRRALLGGGLSAATLAMLAGCTPPPPKVTTNGGQIVIPDTGAKIPSGAQNIHVVDSGDMKKQFWEAFLPKYTQKHSNVTTKYDGLPWNTLNELVPVSQRNGTLPDILMLSVGPLLNQAIAERWIMPFDDIMPGFSAWKAQFPKNTLFEGVNMFDGKVYSIPMTADRRYSAALFYNKQLMQDAGYDPQSKPLTWDDYRNAAKKITQAGNGKTFGVVLEIAQPGRLEVWMQAIVQQSGLYGANPSTGDFDYTNSGWTDAFDLLGALMADKSIMPGSANLTAPQSWPRVASGNAGMVTAGVWVVSTYETTNPDFKFGISSHPSVVSKPLPFTYQDGSLSDSYMVSASTKAPEVVGDIFAYAGSLDGGVAWTKICGPGSLSIYPAAVEAARSLVSDAGRRSFDLDASMVAQPNPIIRNPAVAIANQQMTALTPTLGNIIAGYLTGSVTDVKSALSDLRDRSNKQRDDGIAKAVAKGAKVSRNDWVFKNFKPGVSYTSDMYSGA